MSKQVINSLVTCLEKIQDLYNVTHLHHWNIEGINFIQVHKYLEENYLQVALTLDAVAERIRTLGAYVEPINSQYQFAKIDHNLPSSEKTVLQIKEVIAVSKVLLDQLVTTRELCEELKDIGTVGLIDSIIPHLGKSIWIYESLIK